MGNYDFTLDLTGVNTMSVIDGWLKDGQTVLEFGPANGRLTRHLSEKRGCKMTIVEIDADAGAEAARYAQESFVGAEAGNIEAGQWLATKHRYDAIIFADVLEHLRDPQKALADCRGVLAPGGQVLVSVPNVAHNSVLIDLFNDKFNYDETGLLDRTHVHFFTYRSFVQLANAAGYRVEQVTPVYSVVGSNEIDNRYTDVAPEVEQALRKRPTGSVYQYVCRLTPCADACDSQEFDQPFEQELARQTEAQFYCKAVEEPDFEGKDYQSVIFPADQPQTLRFAFDAQTQGLCLRLDPMGMPGVVLLEKAWVENAAGERLPLQVMQSSAAYRQGQLYLFGEKIPNVIFEPFDAGFDATCAVFEYRLLHYGHTAAAYERLAALLQKQRTEQEQLLRDELKVQSQRFDELKGYSGHLEQDIEILKAADAAKEATIAEIRAYAHRLEGERGEQQTYLQHLENDLQEQQAYIQHLEADLSELQAYARHLETDVASLRQALDGKGK